MSTTPGADSRASSPAPTGARTRISTARSIGSFSLMNLNVLVAYADFRLAGRLAVVLQGEDHRHCFVRARVYGRLPAATDQRARDGADHHHNARQRHPLAVLHVRSLPVRRRNCRLHDRTIEETRPFP